MHGCAGSVHELSRQLANRLTVLCFIFIFEISQALNLRCIYTEWAENVVPSDQLQITGRIKKTFCLCNFLTRLAPSIN